VSGIEKSTALQPGTLVSMNLWGFHDDVFAALERAVTDFMANAATNAELPIPTFVGNEQLKVKVVPVDEAWFGMTYAADLALVRAALTARTSRADRA
jgi:hypothetical protein